ncbi:MAG: butyrate kinase [Clostridiales bacterium]|nr:butyrate kinase [Clostridiales bacterium]
MGKKILVINPGSTSTKIAMYNDEECLWGESIEHSLDDLKKYANILDQVDMRHELVIKAITEKGHALSELDAVMSRGGPFAKVETGAYEVDETMLEKMRKDPIDQHASSIGMEIAYRIANLEGIKAYIYDAVTADEMIPLARVVGMKGMARHGQGHNLNMRAAALRLCREQGWDYYEKSILAVHLGSGITLSLHVNGRVADMISDDEGPFAPERAGGLPNFQLIDLCFEEGMTRKEVLRRFQRAGGLISLLGTSDTREVEQRIEAGDKEAGLVYEAMALTVAKNIAKLSVLTCGRIDAIVLTGGIAYSERFTSMVTPRVSFIAPVHILPGENEMEALALGCLRVLTGQEKAKRYRNEQ